jgi:hypothetical protein
MLFGREAMLSQVRGELGEIPSNHHEVRVKGIYRLDITVDGQAADEAIRAERFAGFYDARKVAPASLSSPLVCLQGGHNFTLLWSLPPVLQRGTRSCSATIRTPG